MSLFRLKVCGITRPDDALAVASAGGDAIGLNFFPPSPRFVDDEVARGIARICPSALQKVGVFVNETVAEIGRRVAQLGLDWVQLHGDEPPETIGQLTGVSVIRAFRCRDNDLGPVVEYLQRCRDGGHLPQAVLLDAWHGEQYGGTGKTLDWNPLCDQIQRLAGLPWILAGGLQPENVAGAIRHLHPDAVDTASGVESAPGIKDAKRIELFVREANDAFRSK